MGDPVTTVDGHTYERAAIEEWLSAHDTSPKTGLRLEHKHLVPNFAIRSAIDEYRQSRASADAPPAADAAAARSAARDRYGDAGPLY